jgi:hypothetical protein
MEQISETWFLYLKMGIKDKELGILVHPCKTNTREVEVGESGHLRPARSTQPLSPSPKVKMMCGKHLTQRQTINIIYPYSHNLLKVT